MRRAAGPAKAWLALIVLLNGFLIRRRESLVLQRGGEAVWFPRKFHLHKEGAALLLETREPGSTCPAARNPQFGRNIGLDPQSFRKPWQI